MAARANTRQSSVRLTTAARVATTLRYVAVSRKGLRTIASFPHSTPIGAQLMAPSAATVVTMLSTIIWGGPPSALHASPPHPPLCAALAGEEGVVGRRQLARPHIGPTAPDPLTAHAQQRRHAAQGARQERLVAARQLV